MSFKLKRTKSLHKNLRRLAREQLQDAITALRHPKRESRDEAVHTARRSCKKVRALLRLVRPVIGQRAYRHQNAKFRDVARPLTEVRDAKILIETLDKLAEHFQQHVTQRAVAGIRDALQANLRRVRRRVLDEQEALASAAAAIEQAQERLDDWADVPDKWPSLGRGLLNTYDAAAAAFAIADDHGSDEQLHEWRKQAKYLRYQLQVLRPAWPERIEELAEEADRLGTLLGDDHDLVVLRVTIGDTEPFTDDAANELLLALIERRRRELQEEARLLGRKYFGEPGKRFVRRLKGYWKTWRSAGFAATVA
ncbi:MAG TPA: CHAD domain-containing protein [Pirellulales bacterium]|jgi:CHAD domain-containing protein|nr:CHAD domain-containing protein [Pirellulales bacterium]